MHYHRRTDLEDLDFLTTLFVVSDIFPGEVDLYLCYLACRMCYMPKVKKFLIGDWLYVIFLFVSNCLLLFRTWQSVHRMHLFQKIIIKSIGSYPNVNNYSCQTRVQISFPDGRGTKKTTYFILYIIYIPILWLRIN